MKYILPLLIVTSPLLSQGEAYKEGCKAALQLIDCRELTDDEIEELNGGGYSDSRWVSSHADECEELLIEE